MMLRVFACAALLVATAGCATVIRGTQQDFTIETTPAGAQATLSTGQSCVTPCTLRLPRKQDFDVTFAMEGYDGGTAHVTSGWSRGGTTTFVVGNIILGGLIGMGVDAANGATRDLWPNPLQATLVPRSAASVAVDQAAQPAVAAADAGATPTVQTAQ
jgi:hypothetical protein